MIVFSLLNFKVRINIRFILEQEKIKVNCRQLPRVYRPVENHVYREISTAQDRLVVGHF